VFHTSCQLSHRLQGLKCYLSLASTTAPYTSPEFQSTPSIAEYGRILLRVGRKGREMKSITPPCYHDPRNMLPRQLLAGLWTADTADASRKVNTKAIPNYAEGIIAIVSEQIPRVDSAVGSPTSQHVTSACSEKVAV